MQLRNRKARFGTVFLLGLITALLFILPWIFKDGFLYLGFDYVEQQIPFNQICNRAVKEGTLLWNSSLDLDTGFLEAYSFYVLGSPFFWLSLIFPADWTYVTVGLMLAFKLAVGAVTAYAWLRTYSKTEDWAMVGGLLYTFSGYQISNLNFNHFADVTALFPLLLLALDQTVKLRKKLPLGIFALTVALLLFTNSVFFVGSVVFLVLYFIVMTWCGTYRLDWALFGRLAIESIFGVGLTGVLLLPTILSLLQNPRIGEHFDSFFSMLLYPPLQFADLLRSLLFPAEAIASRAFFLPSISNIPEFYLPVFGLILAFAWCWSHRKSWITRLLFLCAVMVFIPVLNSIFMAGSAEYYPRWHYMPILILCLATVHALEAPDLSLRPGFLAYGCVTILFFLTWGVWKFFYHSQFIVNLFLAIVFVIIALAGLMVCASLRKLQSLRQGTVLLTLLVIFFSAGTGFINIHYEQKYWSQNAGLSPKQLFISSKSLKFEDENDNWRMDSAHSFLNLGLYLDCPTMTSFSSTVSGSIFDFYEALGIPRTIRSYPLWENDGLRSFLSVKYLVHSIGEPSFINSMPGSEIVSQQQDFIIYQNSNFIPMGYTFDNSMTPEQFQSLENVNTRSRALVRALILTPEQMEKYSAILPPLKTNEDLALSDEEFSRQASLRALTACSSFSRTSQGFAADTTLLRDNLLFFSIPFEKGWRAEVDGTPTQIEKVDFGFMAIPLPAGQHHIELFYTSSGQRAGTVLSVTSGLVLIFCCCFSLQSQKRKKRQ